MAQGQLVDQGATSELLKKAGPEDEFVRQDAVAG
jgi:hypothetical protein